MNSPHAHGADGQADGGVGATPPEGDATGDREAPRYCPTRLLASFALLMAGHGRCVSTDMMLGDREYALWQLACARGMDDGELAAVAVRLAAYFGEAQHTGTAATGTA